MKTLIPLIFALLFLSCEPEEIIKYIERPEYIEKLVKSVTTDTVYVETTRVDTVYQVINEVDTVMIIDTVYIEVVRIDTVERETKLIYDPALKNYVDSFFVYAEMVPEPSRLKVDIVMEITDLGGYVSETTIVNGYFLIKIDTNRCYEAGVYRELLHTLYARPYVPRTWNPMIQNWDGCLEDLNSEGRRLSLITMFIE